VPLVFGVDLGASAEDLSAVLQANGVICQVAQKGAFICPTGLTALSNQPGTATTFWIADGRISRIYQVGDMASLGQADYSALVRLFQAQQMRIQGFLGDVPVRETGREPSWIAGLDDASKLGWLGAGMFWREVVWETGGRKISLTLRGEKGKVLMVLGLEPRTTEAAAAQAPQAQTGSQAKSCTSAEVAAWMMDLFPPATPALRAAQEESDSAVPAVGYPVPYAVTAVLVLVAGYLALFL